MIDTPSGVARAGALAADAHGLRDRVVAAIGNLYLVGDEVGRGGMAVVYAAEDVRLQRKVALKVLPPDLAFRSDVRERFVREAQTAARLNHPHIVPIYAVHEAGGMVCFAMSLVEGESLAAYMQREPRPSFVFVAHMLEQIADALAYAHASGIVHRDVKPDNVLIDRESGRAMMTDFGIARAAEGGSRLTQTGVAVGTPAFMSPEQATGDREIDGRSDVYSLGIIGYLMLAGKLPFEAASTPAMLMKHVSDTPPPLRAARPDAPLVLVEIIERCLAKRPQDRWDSAIALRDALRRAQRDGSLVAPSRLPASAPLPPVVRAPAPATSVQRHPERDDPKFGHRSEDWAPRRVVEAEPAPRAHPAPGALPPIPQLPPLPAGADRSARREWKKANQEAIKDWRVAVRDQRRTVGATSNPAAITERVGLFRRHIKALGIASATSVVSLAIGAGFGAEPMLIPFVGGLLASIAFAQMSMLDAIKLRRAGISPRAAFGEDWKRTAAASDRRTHSAKLEELLDRIGGPTVLASPHGQALRNGADDRLVIAEIASSLDAADRALVPDVEPTADALLERISALASGLERLDRDLPGNAVRELQARIVALKAEPPTSPDRDRRLMLLTRQRDSLEELAVRRDTMQRQLESAAMALRSLRFDVVKLRTMGVGAMTTDLTGATQEARALSRDLGYVIDAAEESRKL